MMDQLTEKYMRKLSSLVAEAGRGDAYEKYFMQKLEKAGYDSIKAMPKDKRKKFFTDVNVGWKSKEEMRRAQTPTKMKEKEVDEVRPPGTPTDIYKGTKSQYRGEPEKAYATMWALKNKGYFDDEEAAEEEMSEVAPPGREDQVMALKKKFGSKSASPFKIAWAQYHGGGHRDDDEEVEEAMKMLEITPPGFPLSVKESIISYYSGNKKKAYPAMWQIHEKMKGKSKKQFNEMFSHYPEEAKDVNEISPPGFPKSLYNKIKKQYPGEPDKAYATMWKVDKNLKEIHGLLENDKEEEIPDEFGGGDDEAELINKAPGQDAKGMYENDYEQDHHITGMNFPNPAPEKTGPRTLSQIAREIYRDWKPVNYAAKPYLEAMSTLDNINQDYGMDSGRSIVAYFLGNAAQWRGPVAQRIKKELNAMLKKHEEELAETSGTGGVGGYATPFAFTGVKSGNEKRRKNTATTGTGYKLAGGEK